MGVGRATCRLRGHLRTHLLLEVDGAVERAIAADERAPLRSLKDAADERAIAASVKAAVAQRVPHEGV